MQPTSEQCLPPSDRTEPPEPTADPSLIAAIKSHGLSHTGIARAIGYSSGAVSTYLSGKYAGNLASIEVAIREWLRDLTIVATTGVPTIDTDISRLMHKRFEEFRINRELVLMVGNAGIGKSRAIGRYLLDHTLAIGFRALPWRSGMNAIAEDLSKAAGINRLAKGEKRWDAILDRTTGSGRILIVDDAQELAPRALQCCVDYHEETGNPVCLIGLPAIKQKLLSDARRARRIDAVVEIKVLEPLPLIIHLVNQFATNANGHRDTLIDLCSEVVAGIGAFGSVEKQLRYAARAIKKRPDLTWPAAFRAAHKRLLRDITLKLNPTPCTTTP